VSAEGRAATEESERGAVARIDAPKKVSPQEDKKERKKEKSGIEN
jgi:hypothetical protein